MGITEIIAKYISDSKIPLEQVASDTEIEVEKLTLNSKYILSSQEMLTVCSYLRISPEELMEKYHDYI
ncbi:hypothetical protein [Pseudobutyrivibrio sp.]|jgi:hypothetical protein